MNSGCLGGCVPQAVRHKTSSVSNATTAGTANLLLLASPHNHQLSPRLDPISMILFCFSLRN